MGCITYSASFTKLEAWLCIFVLFWRVHEAIFPQIVTEHVLLRILSLAVTWQTMKAHRRETMLYLTSRTQCCRSHKQGRVESPLCMNFEWWTNLQRRHTSGMHKRGSGWEESSSFSSSPTAWVTLLPLHFGKCCHVLRLNCSDWLGRAVALTLCQVTVKRSMLVLYMLGGAVSVGIGVWLPSFCADHTAQNCMWQPRPALLKPVYLQLLSLKVKDCTSAGCCCGQS